MFITVYLLSSQMKLISIRKVYLIIEIDVKNQLMIYTFLEVGNDEVDFVFIHPVHENKHCLANNA
jgi:hypothetical protein